MSNFLSFIFILTAVVRMSAYVLDSQHSSTTEEIDIDIDAKESLVYHHDHEKKLLYCEFASVNDINYGSDKLIDHGCEKRNKDMILYLDGEPYLPYYAYSNGLYGKLLKCNVPINVTLHNCTGENNVYSKCNYSCKGNQVPKNSWTKCKLHGPYHNISVDWTDQSCQFEDDTNGDGGSGNIVGYVVPVVLSIAVVVVVIVVVVCCRKGCCGRIKICRNDRVRQICFKNVTDGKPPDVQGADQELLGQQEQIPEERQNQEQLHQNQEQLHQNQEQLHQNEEQELVKEGAAQGAEQLSTDEYQKQDNKPQSAFNDYDKAQGTDVNFNIDMKVPPSAGTSNLDQKIKGMIPELETSLESPDGCQEKNTFNFGNSSKYDFKCTTSVDHLIDQPEDFAKELCELFEVTSDDKENTLMGFAEKCYREVGIVHKRGVKVFQDNSAKYFNEERPCLGFLNEFAKYGIKIGQLVEYFNNEDQIELLLRFHSDCDYCSSVRKTKKYTS